MTSLATLPGPNSVWKGSEPQRLWVGEHGKPRVAYLFDADEAGLPIKTTGAGESSRKSVVFDGQRIELLGIEAPYLTACEDLDGTRWRRIEAKATTWAMDLSLGYDALDCYRTAQRGSNLYDRIVDATCGKTLDCNVELDDAEKRRLLTLDPHAADTLYSVLNSGASSRFYFAVVEGDSLHPTPPIFFCTNRCESLSRLAEVTDDPVSLSLNGDYLMVATEYENANARIYDTRTGRLVVALPKARSAVWLPADAAR